jgi:hypothetical protein
MVTRMRKIRIMFKLREAIHVRPSRHERFGKIRCYRQDLMYVIVQRHLCQGNQDDFVGRERGRPMPWAQVNQMVGPPSCRSPSSGEVGLNHGLNVSIHLRAAGCHCEEPGDEAIFHFAQSNQGDCFASLAMTNWWFSPSPARVNGYD